MKKICFLVITIILISNLINHNYCQTSYISELFEHTLSATIHTDIEPKYHNNIYTTYDSVLFVANRKGFEYKTQKGHANIFKINVFTGEEETCIISPSPAYLENGGKTGRIWIWALAATDSSLFVAVDEGIWVYHLTETKQFKYTTTIYIENVSKLELVTNTLHAFVENSDGFDWFKVNLFDYEINKNRHLVLKNRFFLQIAPVKVISINNNALYLLQQNTPAIEKYSLTGELLVEYPINISNWQQIPKEITNKLDSLEDITERNYAFSKFSIFDYQMMHLFYVFSCERFLMIAIDRNKLNETFITPYFVQIIGDSTMVEPYSVKLDKEEKYGKKHFPFPTEAAEGNIIFAQINEYVTQINRSTTVSWQNKTQKEFKHEVNLYYKDNEPIEKMETYYFIKNYIPVDSVQFLDYDDHPFFFKDVKKEKAIFIVSQYPQCSTCIKVIWDFFSNMNLNNIELYNVAHDCPTYLMKKENIMETNVFLGMDYTPLFIDTKTLNPVTKCLLSQKSNPIIILFDKKLGHIEVITSTYIIRDLKGNLFPSFLNTIDNFIGN